MDWIFFIFSLSLLLAHYTFFFRAFFNRKREFTPKQIDKLSKLLASSLLLPTAISGLFTDTVSFLKIVPWLPIVVIIVFGFKREMVKRYPYLLPVINALFITITFFTATGGLL